MSLDWTREQTSNGVEHVACGPAGKRFRLWSYEHVWIVGVTSADGSALQTPLRSDLSSLADAKLAAEALAAGADPDAHRLSFSKAPRPGKIRGTRVTLHTWRCSCGYKQVGTSPTLADARRLARDQHWWPVLAAAIAAAAEEES